MTKPCFDGASDEREQGRREEGWKDTNTNGNRDNSDLAHFDQSQPWTMCTSELFNSNELEGKATSRTASAGHSFYNSITNSSSDPVSSSLVGRSNFQHSSEFSSWDKEFNGLQETAGFSSESFDSDSSGVTSFLTGQRSNVVWNHTMATDNHAMRIVERNSIGILPPTSIVVAGAALSSVLPPTTINCSSINSINMRQYTQALKEDKLRDESVPGITQQSPPQQSSQVESLQRQSQQQIPVQFEQQQIVQSQLPSQKNQLLLSQSKMQQQELQPQAQVCQVSTQYQQQQAPQAQQVIDIFPPNDHAASSSSQENTVVTMIAASLPPLLPQPESSQQRPNQQPIFQAMAPPPPPPPKSMYQNGPSWISMMERMVSMEATSTAMTTSPPIGTVSNETPSMQAPQQSSNLGGETWTAEYLAAGGKGRRQGSRGRGGGVPKPTAIFASQPTAPDSSLTESFVTAPGGGLTLNPLNAVFFPGATSSLSCSDLAISPNSTAASAISDAFQPSVIQYNAVQIPLAKKRRPYRHESFPVKLHRMIVETERKGMSDIVSFTESGRAFRVHKPKEFTEEIIPNYFRQTRFASFRRQLSMYGFQRIASGPDAGAMAHLMFLRSDSELCKNIKRVSEIKNGG